jgi:hypothetical protein
VRHKEEFHITHQNITPFETAPNSRNQLKQGEVKQLISRTSNFQVLCPCELPAAYEYSLIL